MANTCDIDILICTESTKQAESLETTLSDIINKAREERKGVFLGSKDRYFFNMSFERIDSDIRIYAEVKWSLNYTEVKDVIDWFRSKLPKPYISIHYEETGCCLYGEYVYDGETIMDTYLDEHNFPIYQGEEDLEEYEKKLEEAYRKYSIDYLVWDYTERAEA